MRLCCQRSRWKPSGSLPRLRQMCHITVGKGCVQNWRAWPAALHAGAASARQLAQKGSKRAPRYQSARSESQTARCRCSQRALRHTVATIAGAAPACRGARLQHPCVHVCCLHMHRDIIVLVFFIQRTSTCHMSGAIQNLCSPIRSSIQA